MSLMLEDDSTVALIIKTRLILVPLTDDLGWYITSNQQRQILVQNLNRIIVSRPNVTQGQMLHSATYFIPINLMVKENFPTNTLVWNSLAIEMTADRNELSELPMGAEAATVLVPEHQSSGGQMFHDVQGGWPTTNWSQPDRVAKSNGATSWWFGS